MCTCFCSVQRRGEKNSWWTWRNSGATLSWKCQRWNLWNHMDGSRRLLRERGRLGNLFSGSRRMVFDLVDWIQEGMHEHWTTWLWCVTRMPSLAMWHADWEEFHPGVDFSNKTSLCKVDYLRGGKDEGHTHHDQTSKDIINSFENSLVDKTGILKVRKLNQSVLIMPKIKKVAASVSHLTIEKNL